MLHNMVLYHIIQNLNFEASLLAQWFRATCANRQYDAMHIREENKGSILNTSPPIVCALASKFSSAVYWSISCQCNIQTSYSMSFFLREGCFSRTVRKAAFNISFTIWMMLPSIFKWERQRQDMKELRLLLCCLGDNFVLVRFLISCGWSDRCQNLI